MYLVFFIILVILLFVYFLFKYTLSAFFIFDTDNNDLNINLKWLYPFIELNIKMFEYSPFLSIFLFNKKVYAKTIKPKHKKRRPILDYYRSLNLNDTFVKIYYSLNDPFPTGISFAIIQSIQAFVGDISITQYPNFVSDHAYMIIQSGTKINLGKTVLQLLHIKINKLKNKRRKKYGTVQYG